MSIRGRIPFLAWVILATSGYAGEPALWLDAGEESSISLRQGTVSKWKSLGKVHPEIGQAEVAKRPRLGEKLNGRDTVHFDGGQFLEGAPVLVEGDDSFTIVALWRPHRHTVQSVFEQAGQGGGRRVALLQVGETYGFNGEGNDAHCSERIEVKEWRLTALVVTGAKRDNVILLDNGNEPVVATIDIERQNVGVDGTRIGRKLTSGGEFFQGDLAELRVFDSALPRAELGRHLAEVKKRWGMTFEVVLPEIAGNPAQPDEAEVAMEDRLVVSAEQAEFFETRIRPVLANICYECHSERSEKLKGNLHLDSRAGLLAGGDLGPAIDLGNLPTSRLIEAIGWQNTDLQMPPKRALPEAVRADLQKWVEMGAPWPGSESKGAVRVPGEVDFVAERAKHWAWTPVVKPAVPEVDATAGAVNNEIDRFVRAEQRAKGLTPSAEAPKHTLIRRLYFDLIGLPPSVEQAAEFVEGRVSYEEVVEQLLASPRYGERWGRHWLDVARYSAGFGGFLDKPKFTQEWRYRDWVIEALNRDMPYDEFLRLQIAGDLVDSRHAVATGFFALGPAYVSDGGDPNSNAMAKSETLDDRVDTLGRGLLGLTMACARCHDHKFDPIPTMDYYSIAGIFQNTGVHEQSLAPQAEVDAYNAAVKRIGDYNKETDQLIQRRAQELADAELKRLADYMMSAVECLKLEPRPDQGKLIGLGRERGLAGAIFRFAGGFLGGDKKDKDVPALDRWFETGSREEAEKFQSFVLANQEDGQVKKFRGKYFKFDRNQVLADIGVEFETEVKARRAKHDEMRKNQPEKYATAHSLRDTGSGNMKVALRGSLLNPGPEAPRRFLRLLDAEARLYEKGSGRLELADSIASAGNPLTARVFVNRLWGWHFGQGIVRTPSNFGTIGAEPSHPELLDWLAATFVERGWSIKEMHRLIVTSATWKQSSRFDESKFAIDGDNAFLWRMNPRKLEVEAWRDALLVAAGQLDLTMGGKSYDDPAGSHRRTVYARTSRNGDQFAADRFLSTFDFPPPRASVAKRIVTITPQQSLFLLNNTFFIDRAKILATRLEREPEGDGRIELAYRLLFARSPTAEELAVGRDFLTSGAAAKEALPLTPLARYSQALLASNEFMFIE